MRITAGCGRSTRVARTRIEIGWSGGWYGSVVVASQLGPTEARVGARRCENASPGRSTPTSLSRDLSAAISAAWASRTKRLSASVMSLSRRVVT